MTNASNPYDRIVRDLESELELLTERSAFQARIHDLATALAARDQRIAELEAKFDRLRAENATLTRYLEDGMVSALQDSEDERRRIAAAEAERDAARAEVPGWCKELVTRLWNESESWLENIQGGMPKPWWVQWYERINKDQLRACGIETP